MSRFGFKAINPKNWLQPDPVLRGFVRLSPDGRSTTISGEEYLRAILEPKLIESVPAEAQALFEVARGAMLYGYFFYPLYTLAAEQLFRVAEAAVIRRCQELCAPKSKKTFKQKIDWLAEKMSIHESELAKWNAIRELRNISSHPDSQSILTPGNAISCLEGIAQQVNCLFSTG